MFGRPEAVPSVAQHLALRLRRERRERFGVGFNAQACTFNMRNFSALASNVRFQFARNYWNRRP